MERTKQIFLIAATILLLVLLPGMGKTPDPSVEEQLQHKNEVLILPEPSIKEQDTLSGAIYHRRSVRDFRDEPLTIEEVSQLLWSCAGQTADGVSGPTRAYPSAGGIYPLEIFVVADNVEGIAPGIYRYKEHDHALELIREGEYGDELMSASLDQGAVGQAPVNIIIAADYERTSAVYGSRGRQRYVPIDAGAAGQNLQLQAVSLELASVMLGAFEDEAVQKLLQAEHLRPLLIMPVGRPR